MRIAWHAISCLALIVCSAGLPSVGACPFCSAPMLTLSEQLAQSDVVVLAQWVEATKPTEKKTGNTTYEIRQVVRGSKELRKESNRIKLARYRVGKIGDLFMLMGSKGTVIEWSRPLEVTETSFNYIVQAPSPESPPEKRLAYFAKFLEFPDSLVANDAYGEFATARYEDITPLAKMLPRKKVRKWIVSEDTPVTRRGLYGLLLGLCGNEEDAKLMEKQITEETEDFRLGIDGVISGYLLLTGAKGLDVIDEIKLKNQKVAFSETFSTMQSLRFMWQHGAGRIDKERLRQSMRLLLSRPELADLVIADLARWRDWDIQDRLMELYGAEEYDVPSIKRAIVRYMLASSQDIPKVDPSSSVSPEPILPDHVAKGRNHLAVLEKKDPKSVREAKRFFFLK